MFVSKRRFILKTCGTTLLLQALVPLLEVARQYCGFDAIKVSHMVLRGQSHQSVPLPCPITSVRPPPLSNHISVLMYCVAVLWAVY